MKRRCVMIRKGQFIFYTLLVLAMIAFPGSIFAQPVKEVKIGVLADLTGPLAKIGETCKRAFDMAVEDVNASGGIKALGGAKLQIAWGDTQTKPAIGVAETERLINREGVPIVLGGYASGVIVPASATGQKLKTPFFVYIPVADVITKRGYEYVFRLNAPATQWSMTQSQYLADLKKAGAKVEKIALFYEDTDWGQDTAKAHRKFAQEFGLKIVADEPYPARSTDLTVKLLKVKGANPDVLIPTSYIADAILIAETRQRIGWKDVLVCHGGGGALEPEYLALGKIVEGEVTINHFNYDSHETARKINERFRAKYGVDMNGNAGVSYQSIIVVAEALEMAKSLDKDTIREALTKVTIEPGPKLIMPYKRIKFDNTGQNDSQLLVTQNVGGRFVTVWPEKFASAKTKVSK